MTTYKNQTKQSVSSQCNNRCEGQEYDTCVREERFAPSAGTVEQDLNPMPFFCASRERNAPALQRASGA